MKRFIQISSYIFYFLSVILIVLFLIVRYRFSMMRYVDMDEWAYLYWTSHMLKGIIPYRDFGFMYPPGYLLFLAPLFLIHASPTFPLLGGRILALVVFIVLCIVMMVLFYHMRKRWTAIFVGLLLVFLPLPSDKFIEIRPDTLAMVFAMMGTLFQVVWMDIKEERKRRIYMFWSGFCYSLSILVIQKTVPQVLFASSIAFLWLFITHLKEHKLTLRFIVRYLSPYVIGLATPAFLFICWMITTGYADSIWYSITRMPKEVAQLGHLFPLPPLYYFRYIDLYYGKSGFNIGFILNHLFWVVGLSFALIRFFVSLYTFPKKRAFSDLLLSGVCIIQIVLFVWYFPFKHSQYLIPLSLFVVYYIVDGITNLWLWATFSKKRLLLFNFWLLALFILIILAFRDVNTVRFTWWNITNEEDKRMLTTMVQTIPQNEFVLDLVGLSLYYPQPYYSSCAPIGQIAPLVSRPFPPLIPALIATDTKFIYQGSRLSTLSSGDQQYIVSHYTQVGNNTLLIRNDYLDQYKKYFAW